MVKMVATPKEGRTLKYGTRRLMAGDEFEVPDTKRRKARILQATGKAELAPPSPRRGRPPKAETAPPAPEPEAHSDASDDPYPDKNVPDLRKMVEDRGLELPAGYVSRAELIAMLTGESDA